MPGKHMGGVEIHLCSLLILALDGRVWSASPSDSFSPQKKGYWYQFIMTLVGPLCRTEKFIQTKMALCFISET
jgi:hypothetical protein